MFDSVVHYNGSFSNIDKFNDLSTSYNIYCGNIALRDTVDSVAYSTLGVIKIYNLQQFLNYGQDRHPVDFVIIH